MKPTIINHPFHVIKLNYCSEGPLSTLEQEAITKYVELHNGSQSYKELLTRLHIYYTSTDIILLHCQITFNNLQNEYLLLTPMLHYLQEGGPLTDSEIASIDESERVCYDTQPLLTQLHSFNNKYDNYIEDLRVTEQEFATVEKQKEKLDQLFDVFEERYLFPIITDYKNRAIDFCPLQENFDDFRSAFSDLTDFADSLYDARATFLDQHILLHNKIVELDKDILSLFAAINGDAN
ncbi:MULTISPECIES: hypothetical protein [Niastella]|uniref:Autophagy-related protein 17 n=1 Tax=Niastella soli TaxID=2821487 RepID=A0ABS3YXJ1_9BACT|nr:hypothetical protein [Niastella soli]MBO9202640.1 hypothetical protein [Niastella soli]